MGLLPQIIPQRQQIGLGSLYLTPTPMSSNEAYWRSGSQGTIAPYAPTLGDRAASVVSSGLQRVGVGKRAAGMFGSKVSDAAQALTPFGAATEAQQAKRSYQAGNYVGAAAHGLGALLSGMPDGGATVMHSIIAPLFHGSPHAFEKFALDKIGTGEGAQAYGHGLYFAENPAVAKEYQKQTAGDGFLTAGGQVFDPSSLGHINVRSTLNRTGSLDAALAKANELLPTASAQTRPLLVQDAKTLTGLAQNGGISRNAGHLYEVKLDANPEDFLDWDAPLARQPVAGRLPFEATNFPNKSGGDLVQYGLGNGHAGYLMDKGIPGIRYLDQGSRGVGGGTSNYVVFDPSIIDILARH